MVLFQYAHQLYFLILQVMVNFIYLYYLIQHYYWFPIMEYNLWNYCMGSHYNYFPWNCNISVYEAYCDTCDKRYLTFQMSLFQSHYILHCIWFLKSIFKALLKYCSIDTVYYFNSGVWYWYLSLMVEGWLLWIDKVVVLIFSLFHKVSISFVVMVHSI